jgi:hypothetical protein
MLLDLIMSFWGIGVGVVAFIVWLSRLEAKALANAREIIYMKERRTEDLKSARDAREETSKRLDEILSDVRETNRDIKDILRRIKIEN